MSESTKRPSRAWYLLPLIFSLLGGIIGYIILKVKDVKMAKNVLYIGIGTFVLGIILVASIPSPPSSNTELPEASTPTVTSSPIPTSTPISTPEPTPEPTITPIRIESFDLSWEFDDNAITAEAKYEGQIIEVSGMVLDIDRDLTDTPYVNLEGMDEYGLSCVRCEFSASTESQLMPLKKYDWATIRGSYSDYRMSRVVLENCELISIEEG